MTLASNAKVNTFLAVGQPDATGYHPIRSVFQEISLADRIEIEVADVDQVSFTDSTIPASNTVTKALTALRAVGDIPPLAIHIEKVIPSEAGLGGGSSNAAAVIRWAKDSFAPDLPESELNRIAAKVGADVPFFLLGGRAKAEGYGEILSPIPPAAPYYYLILKPDVGCSTAEMYRKLDALDYEWRDFPEGDELYNDFERVAPCECLDWIEQMQMLGAVDAGLSGSGSAVFGRFATRDATEEAFQRVRLTRKWIAEPITRVEIR